MGLDFYASNNKKFYISIKTTIDRYGFVSLFTSNGDCLCSDIKSSYEIGGKRGAVSNDGKLFATAAYSHTGVDLRDLNGKLIWNTKEIKKVQGLAFSTNDQYLYVWNGDEPEHTYYVRIEDGKIEKRIVASSISPSVYSDDLILYKEDTLLIGTKKVKSPSFCFLDAIATKEGICVSPVGNDLRMYDYNANLIWEANFVNGNIDNHIVQLSYDGFYIYGLSLDRNIYKIKAQSGDYEIVGTSAAIIIDGEKYIDLNGKLRQCSVVLL